MASVQGWGRQAWGDGNWNEFGPIPVTGIGLTASNNDVTVTTDQVISVTGIGLTSNTNDVTATGIAHLNSVGIVTQIGITNAGLGYTVAPTVTISIIGTLIGKPSILVWVDFCISPGHKETSVDVPPISNVII